jgi:hypothetical protein
LGKTIEFYGWAKYFIKYIGNTFLNYDDGSAAIVDLSRCEDGMSSILLNLGYVEKYRVFKKDGKMFQYKNKPIIILTYFLDKPIESNEQTHKGPKLRQHLEVLGYCYESESEAMKQELSKIKSKLSR